MKILVACEESGVVRRALRDMGQDAWSCDIKPAGDGSSFHLQCDVREVLNRGWDSLIAHPECRYLSVSGQHWISRGRIEVDGRPRAAHRDEALEFAGLFFASDIPVKVIEQPVSILSTHFGKPTVIVHPYMFGDDASKATCLWITGRQKPELPPRDTWVKPRMIDGLPRWGNQTDSGQNRLAPSETRSADRAKTYPGMARFIAETVSRG